MNDDDLKKKKEEEKANNKSDFNIYAWFKTTLKLQVNVLGDTFC